MSNIYIDFIFISVTVAKFLSDILFSYFSVFTHCIMEKFQSCSATGNRVITSLKFFHISPFIKSCVTATLTGACISMQCIPSWDMV